MEEKENERVVIEMLQLLDERDVFGERTSGWTQGEDGNEVERGCFVDVSDCTEFSTLPLALHIPLCFTYTVPAGPETIPHLQPHAHLSRLACTGRHAPL